MISALRLGHARQATGRCCPPMLQLKLGIRGQRLKGPWLIKFGRRMVGRAACLA